MNRGADFGTFHLLRDGDVPPGHLTLRRILGTVVDSFGVEDVGEGAFVVRLEKLKGLP